MLAEESGRKPLVRAGMVTDLHHADKPATTTRFYRESLGKLEEAVAHFNMERPAFVVELGDLIDQAASVEQEIEWLAGIEKQYAQLAMPRHYVLGNHCVDTLTKAEFAAHTGAPKTPHHAFEQNGVRFIILDACYRQDATPYERKNFSWTDANIPPAELDWLRLELAKASNPVVVFAHQRLDASPSHSVRNAQAVRAELEKSGRVLAVFQGHSHKNDYQQIGGIHYCTLVAMVEGTGRENSGYSLLDVMEDGSLRLQGFRRQASRELSRGVEKIR
jgi:alkaline phosphatase